MKSLWWKVLKVLLYWLFIQILLGITLFQESELADFTEKQLHRVLEDIHHLQKQNLQLQSLATDLKSAKVHLLKIQLKEANHKLHELLKTKMPEMTSSEPPPTLQPDAHTAVPKEPSAEHEYVRMKIEKGVADLWDYLRSEISELKDLISLNSMAVHRIDNMIEDGANHQRVLLTDLYNLSQSNGAGEWRQKEAEYLGDLVQHRLHYLQNPANCSDARKLVCKLNLDCGFGCQIHNVFYYLHTAYCTQRNLVINSNPWDYSKAGWKKFFKSDTCTTWTGFVPHKWKELEQFSDKKELHLIPAEFLTSRPPFLPQAIPEDLAPRLIRLHGAPFVWWVGQFLKYLLHPQPDLQQDIDNMKEKLKFKTPIVGISVRRTDKIEHEAHFHGIEEYMKYVDEWYLLYEMGQDVDRRRVYLATDDPDLLSEAKTTFPDYEFISNNNFSRSASMDTRHSEESLRGIIMDVHFLSLSNYLVCTFSSQVCRLAYEIMQTYHPDASNRFKSLDDSYYFGGQNAHSQVVLYEHHAQGPEEIDLQPGDIVGIAGSNRNGYSKGINRRTGKSGLYPSYKVAEKLDIVKFPTYPEVKLHS